MPLLGLGFFAADPVVVSVGSCRVGLGGTADQEDADTRDNRRISDKDVSGQAKAWGKVSHEATGDCDSSSSSSLAGDSFGLVVQGNDVGSIIIIAAVAEGEEDDFSSDGDKAAGVEELDNVSSDSCLRFVVVIVVELSVVPLLDAVVVVVVRLGVLWRLGLVLLLPPPSSFNQSSISWVSAS